MLESAIRQRSISLVANRLWNDFEALVVERVEAVRDAKQLLLGLGALGAQLSGSGAAVFGLLEGRVVPAEVVSALRGADHPIHVTHPVRSAIAEREVRDGRRFHGSCP